MVSPGVCFDSSVLRDLHAKRTRASSVDGLDAGNAAVVAALDLRGNLESLGRHAETRVLVVDHSRDCHVGTHALRVSGSVDGVWTRDGSEEEIV